MRETIAFHIGQDDETIMLNLLELFGRMRVERLVKKYACIDLSTLETPSVLQSSSSSEPDTSFEQNFEPEDEQHTPSEHEEDTPSEHEQHTPSEHEEDTPSEHEEDIPEQLPLHSEHEQHLSPTLDIVAINPSTTYNTKRDVKALQKRQEMTTHIDDFVVDDKSKPSSSSLNTLLSLIQDQDNITYVLRIRFTETSSDRLSITNENNPSALENSVNNLEVHDRSLASKIHRLRVLIGASDIIRQEVLIISNLSRYEMAIELWAIHAIMLPSFSNEMRAPKGPGIQVRRLVSFLLTRYGISMSPAEIETTMRYKEVVDKLGYNMLLLAKNLATVCRLLPKSQYSRFEHTFGSDIMYAFIDRNQRFWQSIAPLTGNAIMSTAFKPSNTHTSSLRVELFKPDYYSCVSTRFIHRGEYIAEYTGEHLSSPNEVAQRFKLLDSLKIRDHNVAQLDNAFIDATFLGNRTKFVNHSSNPNCRFVVYKSRLVFQAIVDIMGGDELTFDYGYDPMVDDCIPELQEK